MFDFNKFAESTKTNRLTILDGPSGSGKSTNIKKIIETSGLQPNQIEIFTSSRNLGRTWARRMCKYFNNDKIRIGRTIYSHAYQALNLETIFLMSPKTKAHQEYTNALVMKNPKTPINKSYEKWWNNKKDGKLDFIDSLKEVIKQKIKSLQTKLVIIDEMENLTYLEYKYIFQVFPNAKILLVGDLFQSILSFAGSEYEVIEKLINYAKSKGTLFRDPNIYRYGANILESVLKTLKSSKKNIFIDDDFVTQLHHQDEVLYKDCFESIKLDQNDTWIITARDNFIFEEIVIPHLKILRKVLLIIKVQEKLIKKPKQKFMILGTVIHQAE